MNSAIKYGVIIGVVGVGMQALLYILGREVLLGPLALISLLISFCLYIYFSLQARNDAGGFFTFGEAFKTILTMALISGVLNLSFQAILYNVIDPEIEVLIKEKAIEATESIIEAFDMDSEQAEQALAQAEDNDYGMSVANLLKGFFIYYLGIGGVLSLILAAIIKKSDPRSLNY